MQTLQEKNVLKQVLDFIFQMIKELEIIIILSTLNHIEITHV